jgi:putative tricarboxylic transport membrane protein
MIAGIYYGAMYGGSITSILVNIPGEAASVVTCFDGYKMALQGRAGPALGISAFGSFIAGTLSIIGLMIIAPPLARFALSFGPPEYFLLMCFGLVLLAYLASSSIKKALAMGALGLFLGSIGRDTMTGVPKFCFGITELQDGLGLIPVIMGLFGVSEVLINVEHLLIKRALLTEKIKNILPNLREWVDSAFPILRGTVLGFFLGILPGGSAVISSFASYAIEKKISKHPENFGKGAIEGVAGPESANNAATGGAFIPLLTLGIPSNSVMALLLGSLLIYGIVPGPRLITENPDLFWGVVTSMYIGNAMLLILNLPLIPLWVRLLKVSYSVIFPLVLLFCLIGSYSMASSRVDLVIMIIFGVAGYLMKKFEYDSAPLILALVLGPMMEDNLRQALIISKGNFSIFIHRPISVVILAVMAATVFLPYLVAFLKKMGSGPAAQICE